jgi:NADH-quinone oxidoreductase subunit A
MGQYLPILALLVLAVVFGAISRLASRYLAPRRPTAAKSAPYECGITGTTSTPERFPVTFFLVAMIFIVFDIEIIFLYPYAVISGELGMFGLIEMVVFAVAVFGSFVFLIANGALDWGPVKRAREHRAVDPARTSSTTIRRVGLEGRAGVRSEPAHAPAAAADAGHGTDQGEAA